MNKKGFSSIVILLLIAAGIGIGVWGVQYASFNTASKASEPTPTPLPRDTKSPDVYYMAPNPILAGASSTFIARAKDTSGIARVDISIANGPKCVTRAIEDKPNYYSCVMKVTGTGIKKVTVWANDNRANKAQRTYSVASKATPKPSPTTTPKPTNKP